MRNRFLKFFHLYTPTIHTWALTFITNISSGGHPYFLSVGFLNVPVYTSPEHYLRSNAKFKWKISPQLLRVKTTSHWCSSQSPFLPQSFSPRWLWTLSSMTPSLRLLGRTWGWSSLPTSQESSWTLQIS